MTELQITWFLLIGVLLAGYAILDGFDLGVGMLYLFVTKNDRGRRVMLNAIGPVWDGNEVWLLTGGGAIFAAFPMVYATVFSGFYLALMLVLVALIVRAVSLEFRGKVESAAWRTTWDVAFAVGSFLPALLFGVAVGNILRGVPLTRDGEFAGTFLGLLSPFALVVGLLSTAMFVMQGASWLMLKTDGTLRDRVQNVAKLSWPVVIALWAAATAFARVDAPNLWVNFERPIAWVLPLAFVLVASAYPLAVRSSAARAFATSSAMIALLLALMGESLFPYLVPARGGLENSLTIFNASSSLLTLKTMLVITLIGMPVVIGYTLFIYRHFVATVVIDEHSY